MRRCSSGIDDSSHLVRPLTTMMLGAALAIMPVVVQNWRVTGVPLIQAYGGLNLYLGNTP